MMARKLGIVGGLGPAASAYFYGLITDLTDARYDQHHIEIILYSKPQIPDRTAYIQKMNTENPVPLIIDTANKLVAMGAENIAIPCMTVHTFYNEIARGVNAPVINALAETAAYLRARGVGCVGLMATDGLIAGGALCGLLAENGIDVIFPHSDDQSQIVKMIYEYKANCVVDISRAVNIAERMKQSGADVILLACTELSLLKRDADLGGHYVDMLEILARRAIEVSGGKCRYDSAPSVSCQREHTEAVRGKVSNDD
jgi:aspartate racemase